MKYGDYLMGDKIIKCKYHPKEIIYTKWSGKLYTALQTSESTGEKKCTILSPSYSLYYYFKNIEA